MGSGYCIVYSLYQNGPLSSLRYERRSVGIDVKSVSFSTFIVLLYKFEMPDCTALSQSGTGMYKNADAGSSPVLK